MDKIMVTGSTDGIGKQTALQLARRGHPVVLHGRNPGRGWDTLNEIGKASQNAGLDYINGDYNSLKAVGQMAKEVEEKHPDLAVLINNAGTFQHQKAYTAEGFEKTFGINHLAPMKLTLLLLPLLRKNAPARIVTVSSLMHKWSDMPMDNLNAEKHFNSHDAYSRSKLANTLIAKKLARHLPKEEITSNSLHPGVIGTKLLHAGWGGGMPVPEGAQNPVFVATSEAGRKHTGAYFDNQALAAASPLAGNEGLQDGLWAICLKMLRMEDPFA